MLIGDTAQLPPIGTNESPALDKGKFESMGLHVVDYFLNDVVRQQNDSGILDNATQLRALLSETMLEGIAPKLKVTGYPDFRRITGEHLIDELTWCYRNNFV